jgi:ABC-type branched-subunit amino acid transport system ATPase component
MNVLDRLSTMPDTTESTAPLLLRVAGLGCAFGGQQVLKDVSVELRQGEVVLLRGANGSGKTTLLNILTGNLVPDRGSIELHTGKQPVRFEFPRGMWASGFAPDNLARLGVGRTWQDIRLFDTQSLANNIAVATPHQQGENPFWAVLGRASMRRQEQKIQQVARLRLADLGLGDRSNSSADRVSLGQSKRVAIARAIQSGVKVLCLDEPLAGLDGLGIEEVMGMLRELVEREQLTLIIVEHVFNIPRILDLATTVWTLADEEMKVEAAAQLQPEAAMEGGIDGWLQELGGEMVSQALPGGAMLQVVRVPGVDVGEVVLAVRDLVVYRGKRLVVGAMGEDGIVRGLSFELRRGELGVLQAPNGWGKTTLLEALMGLGTITQGEVRLKGVSIQKWSTWRRVRAGMSLLQSRDNVFRSLTVRETLRIAKVRGIPEELRHLENKRMSDLSGGERQRVILTCFQYEAGELQMLDEPFLALDKTGMNSFMEMLEPQINRASLVVMPIDRNK